MTTPLNFTLKEYNPTIQKDLLQSPQKEQTLFLGSNGVMEYLAYRAQFLEAFIATNQQIFKHWLIVDSESNEVLGDCGFHRWYHLEQVAEIGYGLRKEDNYNKGIMSAVIKKVLAIGFEEMNLLRIEAFVAYDNYASLKILHNMGFVAEGRLNARFRRGQSDMIVLSLLKGNYPHKISKKPYTVDAFERGTLPGDHWTHQAHLKVGLWYAMNYDYNIALLKMRNGIISYNKTIGIPNTASRGYHETMTRFWLRVLQDFTAKYPAKSYEDLLAILFESDCGKKDYPLQFYTKSQINSLEARVNFVDY